MARILYDLFKACLNATLILLALCLFLGWKLSSATAEITENAAQVAARVEGVQLALTDLQAELKRIRATPSDSSAIAALEVRLARIETSLQELQQLPHRAAETAARTAVAELAAQLSQLRLCLPQDSISDS